MTNDTLNNSPSITTFYLPPIPPSLCALLALPCSLYVVPPKFMAVDTGCAINLCDNTILLLNEAQTPQGLQITMANKSTMHATLKGFLHLALPPFATECHRILNLHMPLLSVGQHCDAGNTAIFAATKMLMVKNMDVDILLNTPPLYKTFRAGTALWLAPISPPNQQLPLQPQLRLHQANSAYHQPSLPALATFLHATAGFPAKSTFCKATDNGFFATWPELTSNLIRKHLPLSVPSIMGCMQRTSKGVRSTSLPYVPLLPEPPLAQPRSPISLDHLVSPSVIELDKFNAVISTDNRGLFHSPSHVV